MRRVYVMRTRSGCVLKGSISMLSARCSFSSLSRCSSRAASCFISARVLIIRSISPLWPRLSISVVYETTSGRSLRLTTQLSISAFKSLYRTCAMWCVSACKHTLPLSVSEPSSRATG